MTDAAAAPIVAFVFDTDGVVTRTATVHAAAWKDLFDDFLRTRAAATGTPFVPFTDEDYRRYVDGRARADGVAGFLESRGIVLARGHPDDPPGADTICALGNRKNDAFIAHVHEHGVEAFVSTLAFVRTLHERGIRTAVVSASENCAAILESAGADGLFEVRVDGLDAAALGLAGKPDPALFLEAARRLGVAPAATAVVEDAIAGVQAARRGGFGLVVGVDRAGSPEVLAANGADVVVADLAQLELDAHGRWRSTGHRSLADLPSALAHPELRRRLTARPPVVFCDYDGTLTPIVASPELATLPGETLRALDRLAGSCVVGIISGRDLPDVRAMVPTDRIWFAGSHGFDIVGPGGERLELPEGNAHAAALGAAADALDGLADAVPGAWVERKRFAIAIHFRQVDDSLVPEVEAAVDRALGASEGLRKTGGKRIFELRPDVEWDKGRALWWLLDRIEPAGRDALPVYLGDDETDEDAFAALAGRGVGIVVGTEDRPTAAEFRLDDPDEVRAFLSELADLVGSTAR
jgi:trehalose 6-phosphate phosphatase